MPLLNTTTNNLQTVTRPGQAMATGDINAQAIAEYSGFVEHTIERKSVINGMIPMRSITGTNKVTDFAVGEVGIQRVVPGEAPEGQTAEFSNATFTVDTVVNARHVLPLLETFQTSYDARKEIGVEQGRRMAKFIDQSFLIQAAKAANMTQSRFQKAGNDVDGWTAGSLQTIAAAADSEDPALLYAAFRQLFVKMEQKDVSPKDDDVMIALRPKEFYALMDAEQIINASYKSSEGNDITGFIFKAFGCPVVSTNNLPTGVISGHLLSNAANGNAYDGDFTKLVALAFSPKALLAGSTIPMTSDVFYDKQYKSWFVDSHIAYAVGPNRAEYAGAIYVA